MKYCEDCFEDLQLKVGKTLHIVYEVDPYDTKESTCEHCQTNGHSYLYEPAHEHEFTVEEVNQAVDACRDDACFDCPLNNLGDTKLDCTTYLLNLVREKL